FHPVAQARFVRADVVETGRVALRLAADRLGGLGLDADFARTGVHGHAHLAIFSRERAVVLFFKAALLEFLAEERGHVLRGQDFENLQLRGDLVARLEMTGVGFLHGDAVCTTHIRSRSRVITGYPEVPSGFSPRT